MVWFVIQQRFEDALFQITHEWFVIRQRFEDALFQITHEWFVIRFPNLDMIINGILLTM